MKRKPRNTFEEIEFILVRHLDLQIVISHFYFRCTTISRHYSRWQIFSSYKKVLESYNRIEIYCQRRIADCECYDGEFYGGEFYDGELFNGELSPENCRR